MYFYRVRLDKQDNLVEMYISDAYLPDPCNSEEKGEGDDYKFSLIFPMGITLSPNGKEVIVSAGYGD
jgi:hypothetical protein